VLADNRGLDLKRLTQVLAGDLDWVALKALEKDRDRRYGTPAGFAEDIDRYLRREAVLARPHSTAYRVKKFAQRHRAAVLTGSVVAAVLLVGAAVATWQAVAATQARQEALAAAAAEKEAKELAQARAAEARAALEFLERRVFTAARPEGLPGGLGRDVTLRQAVEAALPFVEKSFTDQPLTEARLRMTLGQSFWYLGEAQLAADQWQAAHALYSRHLGPDHPDTLRSLCGLARGYAGLGRYADALRLREETLELQKARLGPDHPDTLRTKNDLACSYADLGRRADALRLREETLALMKVRLGADHPDTLASTYNLATSYGVLGRQGDALRLREEVLARRKVKLGPDHPDTLRSMNGVACSYADFRRHGDAVKLYEEALALQKAKLGPDHPDTFQTMYNLAISYAALGRQADALKLREETLALHRARLGPDHPRTLMSMWGVADSLIALDRGAEAVPVIDECVRRATGQIVAARLLPRVLNLRLRHFEKAGDAAGCRQTAEMWEQVMCADADGLYTAARMRAVTAAVLRAADKSAEGSQQTEAEADRAMAWLGQAVAARHTDGARLKQDRDLDALRERADFTKLVAALQVRPPAN
jgi:tetratricopeptide (TPR) repeat protein